MGEIVQKFCMVFDVIKMICGVYFFDEIDVLVLSCGNENDIGEVRCVLNLFFQFFDEDIGLFIIIVIINFFELFDCVVLCCFDLVLFYDLLNEDVIEKVMCC